MTGNRMIDNILLGTMLLATVASLALFIFSLKIYQKPLPNDADEKQALLSDSKRRVFSEAFKVDKLIVNLKSRTSRLRFLDLETYLVPFKNSHHDLFEENKAIINDIIIDESSRISPSDLNSVSGKLIFENRLKKRINGDLRKQVVKEIFFSRFVIQ